MTNLQEKYKKVIVDEMEKNGIINSMKGRLKSQIIQIIKNEKREVKRKLDFELLTPFQKIFKTKELMLLTHLIIEFLQFYEMEYTLPIFKDEANIKETIKKETLIKDSCLKTEYDENQPILLQIIASFLKDVKNPKVFDEAYKKDKEINYTGYSSAMNLINDLSQNKTNNDPIINNLNGNLNEQSSNTSTSNNITNTLNSIKNKKLTPLSFTPSSAVTNEPEDLEKSKFIELLLNYIFASFIRGKRHIGIFPAS